MIKVIRNKIKIKYPKHFLFLLKIIFKINGKNIFVFQKIHPIAGLDFAFKMKSNN